jgi:hypothetical protein
MSELEKPSDLLDLLKDPASKPEFCQHWKDHLYNSIWKISDLSQLREYNLIVALGVPPSSNERYNAPNGRGDLKTFKKINNVGNNAIFVKNKKFNEPDDEKAYEWVLRILDGKND